MIHNHEVPSSSLGLATGTTHPDSSESGCVFFFTPPLRAFPDAAHLPYLIIIRQLYFPCTSRSASRSAERLSIPNKKEAARSLRTAPINPRPLSPRAAIISYTSSSGAFCRTRPSTFRSNSDKRSSTRFSTPPLEVNAHRISRTGRQRQRVGRETFSGRDFPPQDTTGPPSFYRHAASGPANRPLSR